MRVALQKLDGVEKVDVSLERGLATVALKPGNHVTIEQFRSAIKNNGFNPGSASVEVAGKLARRGAAETLAVSGSDAVLTLAPDPSAAAAMQEATSRDGQTVIITGVVTAGSGAGGNQLQVKSVKPAS